MAITAQQLKPGSRASCIVISSAENLEELARTFACIGVAQPIICTLRTITRTTEQAKIICTHGIIDLTIVNPYPLAQPSFDYLLRNSHHICGVTGDTSLIEATFANKVPLHDFCPYIFA